MKSPRKLLIAVGSIVAVVILAWFSISRASDSNSSSSGSDAMPGMSMSDTTTSQADDGTSTMSGMDHNEHSMTGTATEGGGAMPGMTPLVTGADGTQASAGGLTLEPQQAVVRANDLTRWQLRVTDRSGNAVTKFEKDQTKLMHLIVVRSDLTGYQHLHPALGRGGIFTVELRLARPGTYRAIADFTTSGKRYALGMPIKVPGKAVQTPLPAQSRHATTDGYSVIIAHGKLQTGSEQQLSFTIEKNSQPARALLPYLGAYGHLVALHKPNLAYSHVHPTSEDRSQGSIGFSADFPQSGSYRLFLQFRTSSGVHTAPFTVAVQN